jgi:hypothetical protein
MWGGGITPPFLISAFDEGERSASRLSRLTPKEIEIVEKRYIILRSGLGPSNCDSTNVILANCM